MNLIQRQFGRKIINFLIYKNQKQDYTKINKLEVKKLIKKSRKFIALNIYIKFYLSVEKQKSFW